MATLKIGDRSVTVDDAFLKMTPDEQNAAVEEIAGSLGAGGTGAQSAPASFTPAPAPQAMMPEFDAMGNPTGGMVATPAPGNDKRFLDVVDKGVRMLANGMTFGMADRFAGGMDALTGKAPSYSAGVDAQHAQTQAVRDEAPILAGVAEAAGGLGTGVGLMKNGVTLAGRVGPKLLPRILGFGAEGAAYGAASGAGNTYSEKPEDYAGNAWSGVKTGALLGGALPAAGALSAGVYRVGKAMLGGGIEDIGRAGSAALRAAAQADEAGLRALPTMGPEAMLPDAGPSMLGLAQGAATGNGPGKSQLVSALKARDAGTGERLAGVVDDAFGPAPIPSRLDAAIRTEQRAVSPIYEQALADAKAVDTRPIADYIESTIPNMRGPARAALEQVRSDLNIPGNAAHLDPSPRALISIRQSIDDAMEAAPGHVRQTLGGVRRMIDAELAAKVPGIKAADGQFAELARQRDAVERGQAIFDTGRASVIRPRELADDMAAAALPQGEMVGPSAVPLRTRQGARAEIDRVVGTNVNDLNALERTFGTPQDWNQQKGRIVFGDDPMDRLIEAIHTNRRYRDTLQRVDQGSQTAARTEAAKALEAADGPRTDATWTGLGAAAVQRVVKAMMGLNSEATKDQVARVMASPQADRIVEALLNSAGQTRAGAAAINRALANPAYLAGASGPASGHR